MEYSNLLLALKCCSFDTPLGRTEASSSRVTSKQRAVSTSAPSVGQANRLSYAFEVCMKPWRHHQSPAVTLNESAFSSGEEHTSVCVHCTRGKLRLQPWEAFPPLPRKRRGFRRAKARRFL